MSEWVEYRIMAPNGQIIGYFGASEVECWSQIECAWGIRRGDLLRKGYTCIPCRVEPVTNVRTYNNGALAIEKWFDKTAVDSRSKRPTWKTKRQFDAQHDKSSLTAPAEWHRD